MLLRPTRSLGLYLQQVGRALRPAPGKSRAIVLDHAGGAIRHGLPDEDRDWTLCGGEGKKERKATEEGERITVRQCPSCFADHRPSEFRPFCGQAHEPDARIPQERAGELRRLEAEEAERLRRARR